MPRLKYAVNPAPQGMNSATNPTFLPPNRCQRLRNFRADRGGFLRASLRLSDVHTFPANPDGVSYYYGETLEDDRLLVVANGLLYVGRPLEYDGDVIPTLWAWQAVGGGFTVGKAVQSAHYDTETFFVQGDGIQPLRYDGVGLYQVGITPPASPTVSTGTPASGSDNKSGSIKYYLSFFDSRFRESDVSASTTVDYSAAANVGKCGFVAIDWGDDRQVFGAYVYATTSGGSVKYRIATVLKSTGLFVVEDNFADSIVNTGALAPLPGQYAVPNPASCIAVHKRHLVLNDTTNPKILQINNLDAPTQWASVTYTAADGSRMEIGTHQGAGINALLPFGSLLWIATRQELLMMWGDVTATGGGGAVFIIRRLHGMGVLAPHSFVDTGNDVTGLMQDGGVYSLSAGEQWPRNKISEEIERELKTHPIAELEAAQGAFLDNAYWLAVGDVTYIFDLSAGGGWTTFWGDTTPFLIPRQGDGSVASDTLVTA